MSDQSWIDVLNWFHDNAAFFNFGSIMTTLLIVFAFMIRWFLRPVSQQICVDSLDLPKYPTLPEPASGDESMGIKCDPVPVQTVVHVPSDLTLQFLIPFHANKSLIKLCNTTKQHPNDIWAGFDTEYVWADVSGVVRFIVSHSSDFSVFALKDIKVQDVLLRSSFTAQDFDLLVTAIAPLIEDANRKAHQELVNLVSTTLRRVGVV